ncbi:MAG TPA: transglutaminase family protein [Chthoniobacteraceae bacterium]|jgi:transglutaminase-like putative cysteine protease
MEYKIKHITDYRYSHPAAEAYGEARLTPPELPSQSVVNHRVVVDPAIRLSGYVDHYGNPVHFFSLPFRHQRLIVTNHLVIRTQPTERPKQSLEQSVQEARQIISSALADVFDYLQPTEIVQIGKHAVQWAKRYLSGSQPLEIALPKLNEAIHDSFDYTKGETDNSTPLDAIWKHRKGVCQDFAHVALSILRTAGLPARYVCGYIEATAPRRSSTGRALVGAFATHAWIEVLVPGMQWVALDPTNRQWCDDRYITVSYGRDARDAAPLRGTFKGSGGQKMKVKVLIERLNSK